MPGMTEICVFLAWIAGGFVSGVSGIGGAMVAFPFLAMLLTDISPVISQEAYLSLTKVTGRDPAKEMTDRINSPRVIASFMLFYRNSRKAR